VTASIRGRITLWAFATFALLIALAGALVLGGLERALLRLADRDLQEEVEALCAETADSSLAGLLQRARPPGGGWGDLVFEMRDALEARRAVAGEDRELLYEIHRDGDHVVARSPSLSQSGLDRAGKAVRRGALEFRSESDPRTAGGSLRVATLTLGPYRLALARSTGPLLRIHEAVRSEVLAMLLCVGAVGVLGAYLIATRALAPVRRLADEADRLRSLSEGSLPRGRRADEIDDLARVLNALLERVRADVARTRRFTADAAHEIRTPLAAIRGHLELLAERVGDDARGDLADVLEEVDRLARLVNRLLLLEKLEGAPDAVRRERFDLSELVRELAQHLGVIAREQGIRLSCDTSPAPVSGDREQLRQVFLNLIGNALEHTPAGGSVQLRVALEDGTARATVRDSGPGIAPDRLEWIFDRFASDRSRAAAGTGLGLPIARAIARAHGGELHAASPGGAELILEIPSAP
jgi:signal transduction histidine kinase